MTKIILALSLLGLVGCAGPVWKKPSNLDMPAAQKQFYQCDYESEVATAPMRMSGNVNLTVASAARRSDLFERCMVANGFTRQ